MQERLKLDLYQKTSISQGITTRVNDGGQHELHVTALAYGDAFDLTGWKIKFELTTSAKTISIDAVNAKITAAKEGEFSYTIPKEITGAAGNAERAYFAFEKDDKRITSADINMTILQIVDITAEEARSYIAEYNKLVEELHEITDKYISDSDAKFADINKKITSLQSQITEYQANVKKTADDAVSAIDSSVSTAVSTVNSSSNAAIKAVDDALKQFEAGDFYTKSETDAKFKVVNDLIISQDIPEGANLDDYKKEGEFSKKTPTVVTGAPEGVTGAFRLSVRSMVGSSGIFQTLYDYATRAIYYRIGNTTLGFNLPWQRIANNSEVVHVTGDETIAGEKIFTDIVTLKDDTDWQETTLSGAFKGDAPQWKCYRGKEVRVNFSNLTNNNQLSSNTPYTIFNLPSSYRPLNAQEDVIIIRVAGSWTLTRLIFNTNGTVQIVPANTIPVNTGFSGTSKISIE